MARLSWISIDKRRAIVALGLSAAATPPVPVVNDSLPSPRECWSASSTVFREDGLIEGADQFMGGLCCEKDR